MQVTTFMTAIEFSRFIYFLSLCSCGFTRKKVANYFKYSLKSVTHFLFEARFQNEKKKLLNQINFKAAWVMLHYTGSRTNHIFGAYICSVGIMQSGVTILMNLNFDSMYFYSLTISELTFSNFSCIFLNPNIFPV